MSIKTGFTPSLESSPLSSKSVFSFSQMLLGLMVHLFTISSCSKVDKSHLHPSEEALKTLFAESQPLELRLRSDLYRPQELKKEPQPIARETKIALAQIESQLRQLQSPTPRLIQAHVLLHLILGRTSAAIALLEEATKLHPENMQLRHAMAISIFYHAQITRTEASFIHALNLLAQVNQSQPTPESLFNIALVLEKLGLHSETKKAWQDFLEEESHPGWLDKGRHYSEQQQAYANTPPADIATAIVQGEAALGTAIASDPKAVREYAERILLPAWANAASPGDAQQQLKSLRFLARSLFEFNGDRMLLDETGNLAEHPFRKSSDLAVGHRLLREAMVAYDQYLVKESQAKFDDASARLKNGNAPFLHKINYYGAVNQMRLSRFPQALNTLEGLEAVVPEDFLEVKACVLWMKGLLLEFLDRPFEARNTYLDSLPYFQQLKESQRLSGIQNRLTEVNFYLGNPDLAWKHHQAARELASHSKPEIGHYVIHGFGAEMAREAKLYGAALHFQNEAIAISRSLNNPLNACMAILARARLNHFLGRHASAQEDLVSAEAQIPKNPEFSWEQALAQLHLYKAQFSNSKEAKRLLDIALKHALTVNISHLIAEVYLTRAGVNRQLKNHVEAEADLLAGIEICESVASKLPQGLIQIRFLEARRKLFDAMIHLQAMDKEDPLTALIFSERLRQLSFDQSLGLHEQPTMALLKDLPPHIVLLNFIVLPEKVLAWTIRQDKISFFPLSISQAQLEARVQAFEEALIQRDSINQPASRLFESLILPITSSLRQGDSLMVIPDKCLHQIAFAALFNPQDHTFLAQNYPLGSAPSIAFYQKATTSDQTKVSQPRTALLVGNPSFDKNQFPLLQPLPHAAKEVQKIRAQFPGNHQLLIGAKATKEALVQAIPKHSIFHFGGHALVNHRLPSQSKLLLARDSARPESSVLYAKDLEGLSFEQTRLVVLSACGSAAGMSSSQGPLSLAQAFLASGVSTVLANSQDVEDSFSAAFFQIFYQHLNQGHSGLIALSMTQNHMLNSTNSNWAHPANWARFQLIGGRFHSPTDP